MESEPVKARPSRAGQVMVTGLEMILVVAALVHPFARLVAWIDWRADLISHFQEPALVVTLVAVAVLLWRRPRLAWVLAGLAVLQAVPALRFEGANPVAPDPRSTARLRVLMANLLVDNDNFDALTRLIHRERPDVVGLVEYTPRWLAGLTTVREEYPWRVEAPAGSMGLALWFRERPTRLDPPERLVRAGWPFLHATFDFAGRSRNLWLAHPLSPIHRRGMFPGNPELSSLADRVGATGGSRIVVGDLNCTDGSPHFADFLLDTGLRDSRYGFGRQGSWPTDSPYRIAIDHALVSNDLAVIDRRLGFEIGSDHLPLIIDLAPAATRESRMNWAAHSK